MINITDKISNLKADEIKRLCHEVDNAVFETNDDVRSFFHNLTLLVYDYKMVGKMYDFYSEDVEYHKQDLLVHRGIDDVVENIISFEAAFPNLRTNIDKIIVHKENEDFYKVSRRLHYWGNNYGPSKYGPPTGKSLSDKCMCISISHLKRIDGKWKVVFEINNDSEEWLEEVQAQ